MWDELENFLKKSKNIDLQIEKLEEKKQDYRSKIVETEREINQMVIDEATLGKAPNEEKIERLENRIDRHERKIARLDQRIQAVKDHKNDALKEYVPGLYDGYKKQMEEIRVELEELEKEIIPKAAEYLQFLSKIGKRKSKMREIHNTFTDTVKDFNKAYKKNYAYPDIGKADANNPGLINTSGVKLFVSSWPYSANVRKVITVDDQLMAVNSGGYPPHIALYLTSGEQEMHETKALDKIKQILKGEREDPKQQKNNQKLQKEIDNLEEKQ